MTFRVGIIGITGYGGGEALRLCAGHPHFKLVYAAGESSAGSKLGARYPGLPGDLESLMIEKFDPEALPELDVLFASLPTGASREPLGKVSSKTRIIDIGGDHRYVPGWTYGLADVWPEKIAGQTRIANPGCYPAATLLALAPLLAGKLISPERIIVDAKSGISGAGRGGGDNKFGFAECNEDVMAYGLLKHTHMPEIAATISVLAGRDASAGTSNGLVFTPHLIPMTRGILATIYCRGTIQTPVAMQAARDYYRDRPFVKVSETPPHTKWAYGSNNVFVHYACDPSRELVMAVSAIDNLGKGAAGQAVQNANLACGLEATAGLNGLSIWP